jgi:uncharacterized protein DUF2834
MHTRDKLLCVVYGVIAVMALVATWSQNLAFFADPNAGGFSGFWGAAFANPAAASITLDILFFGIAAFVWMVVEAQRLQIRFVWVYIALSLLIAVSVMFPLFLIARQRRLAAIRS